ncbi:MAG TPA: M48 family metallopeptidase, partial [Firmicutes bacterium]|nr:M48 family metallopeptidase [Bacillota bacterium]
ESVNAFALPDGHVYLFKGLIDASETPDMLAGVMAHEFTHVFHGHHSRMAERQMRGMLIGLLTMAISGQMEGVLLGQMLSSSMIETYGRSAEEDADRNGVLMMLDAGYDPLAYFEMLQVLEQQSIHRPGPGGNYFTVHPNPDQRIRNVRNTLAQRGISVPEIVYRVHLPLIFFQPLTDEENDRLEGWEKQLLEWDESAEAEKSSGGYADIPVSLLNENRLRYELFSGINIPDDGVCGVVATGEKGIFYIAGENELELTLRAERIIGKLGDIFLEGLRDYEVQGRNLSSGPALVARRRNIATVTESDAELLGMSVSEVNETRVKILRDLLYFYYVNRRI